MVKDFDHGSIVKVIENKTPLDEVDVRTIKVLKAYNSVTCGRMKLATNLIEDSLR